MEAKKHLQKIAKELNKLEADLTVLGSKIDSIEKETKDLADVFHKESSVTQPKATKSPTPPIDDKNKKPALPKSPKAAPFPTNPPPFESDNLIVLEVGHGDHPDGFEPGAVDPRTGSREWDLNKVCSAACLGKLHEFGLMNVRITDSGTWLSHIGKENKDADVFVSVHHNAFSNPSAQGAEALMHKEFWHPNDEKLAELCAKYMSEELKIKNRGIKTMNLSVLKGAMNAKKPGQAVVLVEPYFITGKDVTDHKQWSEKAGIGIAKAIKAYLDNA